MCFRLVSAVTFGYAFAAVLLFGHQFGSTATVTGAFMLLIDIVVVMDTGLNSSCLPSSFYPSLSSHGHADKCSCMHVRICAALT